ncbi:sensor histidine kinase [Staphylococcus hyicus]|uniref:sensor histidine kinase n=1 Tax=Staphylococcus hyicus TaxID=1284 RepID=UPI00208EA258|nr:sensor histidine kinase [Staphylococcus hyicus]MCO4330599.1 sensor histidine kinase [Staphylococcus hyicus]MCO4332997.1 sensor histidine kinase [Staphylococcus hyicus]UWF56986.1 sensor histidine kinase [Staphylococcus hyicus]
MCVRFYNHILSDVCIYVLMLMLFLFISLIYDFETEAYILTLSVSLFVFSLYIIVKWAYFKKQETLKQTNDRLASELQHVKMMHRDYQRDLEHYFLTWVHQIKTPITASKLLLERNEAGMVNRVRQEITEIENYTNLALNYLKLLSHETDMVVQKVALDDIVKPLIQRYALHFIEHRTRIHTEHLHCTVTTDAQWTKIMIEQILNNALKYAKGGDIWIEFDAHKQQLTIKDNGMGISKADLPKIFEKGYSGTNGRLNDKSSGIGLFIVKEISEKLQHPITVQSELGVLTQFTIQFPKTSHLTIM